MIASNRIHLPLLIMLLLGYASAATIFLSLTNYIVNQPAQYNFNLNIGTTSIIPGTATLVFDSTAYSFTATTAVTGCFNTIDTSTLYNCILVNSSAISFRWTSTMDSLTYISFSTFNNPTYVNNYAVTLSFVSDGGSAFNSVSTTISGLQPDTLTTFTAAFAPNYTNTLSTVTFAIVTKNAIPLGGSLQLTFSGYTVSNTSALTVSAIGGSSTYINTTASSSFLSNVYFFMTFFKTLVPAGTPLNFALSSLMSPPTTSSTAYSITVVTSATSNYQTKIDQKTTTIANIIDYPTASLSLIPSSAIKVGKIQAAIFIDFIAPTLINFSTDTITVTVTGSSMTYFAIYYKATMSTNVTGTGLQGDNITNGATFPTNAPSDTIAAGTATEVTSLFAKSMVTSGTMSVFVQFFKSGSSYSSNTATITVSPNQLTQASFTPLSSTVSATTTYSFVLQINNPLAAGAMVLITLPTNITIATGTCSVSAGLSISSALSSNILCNANTSQKILVSNISSQTLNANTTITLNVSGITNPATTKVTGNIVYQTFYSQAENTNPVDDSTGFTLTLTPTPLTIPATNFNASRLDNTNIKYTTYSFVYKVYTSFPANGYIQLVMPSAMTLLSSPATAYYLLSSTGINSSATITATISGSYTTLTMPLVCATLPTNTLITITVANLLNYYSYKPAYFQIVTYTSDNYGVEQSGSTAFSLSNSLPDTSLTAIDNNANTLNGKSITYAFSMKTPSALKTTDFITIQLATTANANTQMAYSTSPTCTVGGTSSGCYKDLANSKLLWLPAANALTAGTTTAIAVNAVILSRSSATPGSITFSTYEYVNNITYLISTYTFTPSANAMPNLINNAYLSIVDSGINSARLNVATTFTLSLQPTNLLITGDYIVVTVPSEWLNIQSSVVTVTNTSNLATMTGSLCTDTTVFCSNYLSDPYKLRIDDKNGAAFPSVSNISFTVSSSAFVSPKNWPTTSYTLLTFATYTSSASSIDSSVDSTTNYAMFALACPSTSQYHCKTCYANSTCSACYQVGSGHNTTWDYGAYYLRQSTGECVSSCVGNYYNNSNFCQLCTAPCNGCTSASTSSCTGCIAPTVLSNSTCLSACPSGYYNSSGTCLACISPCSSCSGSSTTCTGCINTTYLYNGSCPTSCTAATGTYADNTTWTCTACSANCSSCVGTSTNCTTCASTYFNNGTTGVCTQNCPSGTAKYNATTCMCNTTACLTCTLTINTCTSCNSGAFLLGNTCVGTCGNGYYVNGTTCIACVTNCVSCSSSGCSSCNSTTAPLLYNNQCYSACPTGSTASGTSCIACSTGCSSCTSSTVCLSCLSIYYLVVQSITSSSCVSTCSGAYPLVYNSNCVATCPGSLINQNNYCVTNSNNTNTNTNSATTTVLTSTSSKIVPFPITIGLAVLAACVFFSKMSFSYTLVWASLSALAGLMEVIGWLVFIIVAAMDDSSGEYVKTGMVIVLIAYIVTLLLNVLSLCFVKRYIWDDEKFEQNTKKLRVKTKCGMPMTYIILVLSGTFSHKIVDLLFSNLFQLAYLIYKVSTVSKLTPFNYLRYASLIPSIIAIAGAATANYQAQPFQLNSSVFIQSIDTIIVTIIAAIAAIATTKREPDLFEQTIAQKRNETEEEHEHDLIGDDINQFQKEEKGNFQKKYTYSSSIRNTDKPEDRLSRRANGGKNPIGEQFNLTNVPLDNHEDDINRISLNDMTGMSQSLKKRNNNGLAIEEIQFLEESGDNIPPIRPRKQGNGKGKGKEQTGNKYDKASSQKGDKLSKSREQNNSERQKLKNTIEGQLTAEQRQKTKVIRQIDGIDTSALDSPGLASSESHLKELSKNEIKKQKLEALSNSGENGLGKLKEQEREKAQQIQTALNILQVKKIAIEDYLQYLDIIQEEDQDKNSDQYENKRTSSKKKLPKTKKNANLKGSKNLDKSIKKNERKQRSARYQMDDKLQVNCIDDSDLDREPQLPDFHGTPIRARNQSQQLQISDLQELKLSGLRSVNNRSDQLLQKNKQGLHDKVLVSMESGDNDDPSLGEQFQRGNTLKQVEKDDLPPSNLYSTEKFNDPLKASLPSIQLPNRLGRNRLIGDDDHIQYVESEGADLQTVKDELLGYDNDVSPSQFDQPNQRIQNDQISNAPTRPKVVRKRLQETEIDHNEIQIEDLEDPYDEFEQQYAEGNSNQPQMQRYQSDRNLDYDEILMQRRRNERMKELQKIYLPRIDVAKGEKKHKKRNNLRSSNSGRTNQR